MGGAYPRKASASEVLLIISVTLQVAISHRVHRYKLASRYRQANREKREEERGLLQMAWGWHINAE